MNREAQAIVLLLVGGALVHAGFTDLYLRYVKAELRPLLLAAGLVLIIAALATAWYELRRSRAAKRNEPAEHHHAHREPGVSWLLLLPLFALILVGPPALGSYSAVRSGTALVHPPLGLTDLPTANPMPLSVIDYAGRAVYDHGQSLGDRPVTLTGFIALDEHGEAYLTRMVLNCCAADAQPVKVGLTGQIPPVLQPDTWLEVTGTFTDKQTKDPVNDGPIPYIDISQAKPVPAPDEQYESW